MADDELYGDLDTSRTALALKTVEAELQKSEAARRSLEQRLVVTQKREKSLSEENEVLAKNISCLYNTARAEIARKDRWIERLRKELQEKEANARQSSGRR